MGKEVGGLLRLEAGVESVVVVGLHPLRSMNDGFGKRKKEKRKKKCCPLRIGRTERNGARERGGRGSKNKDGRILKIHLCWLSSDRLIQGEHSPQE